MLILSRNENQCIDLIVPPSDKERTIRLTVAEIRGSGDHPAKVKLGFDADKDVKVLRDNAKKIL